MSEDAVQNSRWAYFGGTLVLLLLVFAGQETGGNMGMPVPLVNVLTCIAISAGTAVVCRFVSKLATPFVAGIAGVFGTLNVSFYGPYGGVVGLLVGCLVVWWPGIRGATSVKE